MDWLQIWAMLEVIGTLVGIFTLVCIALAFLLVFLKETIDRRKENRKK